MPNESLLQRMKRLGYVWTESVEQKFQSFAEEAKECLRKEAERCDCLKLLDDAAMYEQFKQNLDLEEEYANIILSKILKLKLEMKVIYWELGKYLFTDAERTMVEYFCNVQSGKVLTRKAFRPENTFSSSKERFASLYDIKHYCFTASHFGYGSHYNVISDGVRESDFLNEINYIISELNCIFLGERQRIVKFFDCEGYNEYFNNIISDKAYHKGIVEEKRRREQFLHSFGKSVSA